MDIYLSIKREFDSISNKVEQDLFQPPRLRVEEFRYFRLNFYLQLNVSFLGFFTHQGYDFLNAFPDIEFVIDHSELLVESDLLVNKNIVHKKKQVF